MLGFKNLLPYLLEDLRSAAARAQENLSRDLSVSLQKVWAKELRRKCETEDSADAERKRYSCARILREVWEKDYRVIKDIYENTHTIQVFFKDTLNVFYLSLY